MTCCPSEQWVNILTALSRSYSISVMYVSCCPKFVLAQASFDHLIWQGNNLFCVETNCLDFCYRFTPSCGTLWTTTQVYGPGSVLGTHGHPPTPYGYLKGKITSVKTLNLLKYCFYFVRLFTWNIFTSSLIVELLKKGISKLLWSLGLLICTMKDVSWIPPLLDLTVCLERVYVLALLVISTNSYGSSCLPFCSPPALLSDEGRADVCGRKASHFFSLAESLRSPLANPFIWVFIRPPWSPTGSCCKAVVFDHLKAECENNVVGFGQENVFAF